MEAATVNLLHYTPMTVLLKSLEKPYKNDTADLTLAERVINVLKHESVAEHITLNFEIFGISRLCLQELVRHRIASLTVESTRYTLNKMLEDVEFASVGTVEVDKYFNIPNLDKKNLDLTEEFYNDVADVIELSVSKMVKWKNRDLKQDYLKSFLLECYKTNLVWTINLRSLKNFLKLRMSNSAHFEIRELAYHIYKMLMNTYIGKLIEKN